MILCIDAGHTESGWCVLDGYAPILHGKNDNAGVKDIISEDYDAVVLERIESFGMPVGKEVFETCEWVGRFAERAESLGVPVAYVYRKEEKQAICHNSKAKDANIRKALIDRFARHDLVNGKGTKDKPDWFYGFRADEWSAYAVGVTYLDRGTDNG